MSALDVLAQVLDELAHDHPRTALPLLVRAVGPLEAPELGVLALEGEHAGQVLLGFTAPDECTALGVVSTGWLLPRERFREDDLDRNRRDGPPAATSADRVAVRSTVLVARDGAIAGRLSVDGAEPVTSPPEAGVMVDLLLRALDCPTAPPAFSTVELFATVWLAKPDGTGRLQLLPGEPDDGSFARWVLGSYPAIDDLAVAATEGLPPEVARKVRAALRRWELAWSPAQPPAITEGSR